MSEDKNKLDSNDAGLLLDLILKEKKETYNKFSRDLDFIYDFMELDSIEEKLRNIYHRCLLEKQKSYDDALNKIRKLKNGKNKK